MHDATANCKIKQADTWLEPIQERGTSSDLSFIYNVIYSNIMNEIWKSTLSRSTVPVSLMHMVLTPLSWSFAVDKERLSSNNASKCAACWKEKQNR